MSAELRVGLIGGGSVAKAHSIGFTNAPGLYGDEVPRLALGRVADIDPVRADECAARWGWAEATSDWRTITRADDIDLVDVITPDHAHAEIVLDALEHGKHVMCEKALAPDGEAAYAMYRAAVEAEVVTQVNFCYRLWPAIALSRRLIERGRLGTVRHFRGRFFLDFARDPATPISWRFRREMASAGALADVGSHLIDIAQYLVGAITEVCANTRTFVPERPGPDGEAVPVDVDDLAQLLVTFEGGATGSLEGSWAATGVKCDLAFEIIGDRGSIRFSWERANQLSFYSDQSAAEHAGFMGVLLGAPHPHAEPFWVAQGQGLGYGDAFAMSVGHTLRAIATGQPAEPSFLDGLRACEVVDATLESVHRHAWAAVRRRPTLAPRNGKHIDRDAG